MAERVGSDLEQFTAVEVIEHDPACLHPDADPAAAEDLRGAHVSAEGDRAVFVDDAFDLDRIPVFDRGSGEGPALTAPEVISWARSVTDTS